MIKRILVGLAGTPFTPVAIERALLMARVHDAELTGVTIVNPRRLAQSAASAAGTARQPLSTEQVAAAVADFNRACEQAGRRHHVVEESGDVFDSMISLARYHDVIVFGLRGLFHYDFGAEPEALLTRLVAAGVRPLVAVSTRLRPISRVLIAYNGSMESAKAMKRFVQFRLWPDARLKIISFDPSADRAARLTQDAAAYCEAHGFTVDTQTNPGNASELLLSAARVSQADMIVMGNSVRSVLLRQILGDTALSVLRETEIPVFLCQ